MTHIVVNVTANDIVKGVQDEPASCPIALALGRHLRRKPSVYVESVDVDGDVDTSFTVPLPDEASSFVRRFDGGHLAFPFKFELDVPPRYLKRKVKT